MRSTFPSLAILTTLLAAALTAFLARASPARIDASPLHSRLLDGLLPTDGFSVQHWHPAGIFDGIDFALSAINKFTTLLGSSNPFVSEAPLVATPPSTGTSNVALPPTTNRIVQGVQNALGPGQDPSPLSRIEGDGKRHYYFPTIDFGHGVFMQTSTDLNTVLSQQANQHQIYYYQQQLGTEAPGFFKWDDNNYLLYISTVGPDGGGYIYVLHNNGQNLLAGWTDLGRVLYADGAPMANYDAFPFVHPNGKRYLLYSALHSVRMSQLHTYTQLGPRSAEAVLSANEGVVIEAPGALIQGNTLNVFWSTGNYFLSNYNIISASISTGVSPMKTNWNGVRKTTIAQSSSSSGVYGPGSGATFTGPDGKPWLAYTCFYNANGFDQTKENPRRVQAQPAAFSGNNLAPITLDKPVRYT